MTNNSYHMHATRITQALIDQIKRGVGTWSAPWHHEGASIWSPTNAVTGTRYCGANIVSLGVDAMLGEYEIGEWATYRQWMDKGAQVRKGQTGSKCVRWVEHKTKTDDDNQTAGSTGEAEEQTATRSYLIPATFTVFNVAQVDGYEGPDTTPVVLNADAVALIDATQAVIMHQGSRAFYRPEADVIQLPELHSFNSEAVYQATIFHELTHWTGHTSRLGRTLSTQFGGNAYAAEELIAELGAAMLTARFGVANQARKDHADYIAGWLEILGEDPAHLFSLAAKAQQAADHITSYPTAQMVAA